MPQNHNGSAVGATASILSPGASAGASPTYQTFTHLAAHHQHPGTHMQHPHHQHQMFAALAHAPLHQHGSGAAGAVQPSSHQLTYHHPHHPAAAAGPVVHTPYFNTGYAAAAAAASLYSNYDPNSAAAAAAAQQHALTHHHHQQQQQQQALNHHHQQQQQAALVAAHRTQLLDDQALLEDAAVGAAEHHQHLVHHQPHQSQHYHAVAVSAHYPVSLYATSGIGSVAAPINTSAHQSSAYLPQHQESYSVSHTPVVEHINSSSAATVPSTGLSNANEGGGGTAVPATLRTASRNRPHFNFNGVSAERRRKRLHQHVAFHFSIRPEWNKVLGHSRASETRENELLRQAGEPIITPVPSDHVHIKHYISFFVEMRVGEVTDQELMDAVEETPSLKVNRTLGTFWRSPPINFRLVAIPTDSLRNEQSQQVNGYEFRSKHTKDTLENFLKKDIHELLSVKDFPVPQLIQADYQSAIIVFDDAESCKRVLQACRIQFHGRVLCAGYNVEGGCDESVCEGFKLDAKSMNSNYNEPAVEVPDASETDAEVLQQQQLELVAQLSPAIAANSNSAASPSQVQVRQLLDSQESASTGPTPLMSADPQPSIAVESRPVSVAPGPPAVQMQSYVTGVPMYQNVLGAPSVGADNYAHQPGFYCTNLYPNPGHVQHVYHPQPHQNHQQHSPAGLSQNSPHGAAQMLEGSGLQYSGYKTRGSNNAGMPNQGRPGLPLSSGPHGPQGVSSGQIVINKNRQQPIAPRFQNRHNTNPDQILDGNAPPHPYMMQLAAASHHSSDAGNGSRGKPSLGNVVAQSGVGIQPQSIVNNNGNSPGSRERRDRRVGDYYQEVDGVHSGRVSNGRGVSASSSALRGRGGRGRGSGGRGVGNGVSGSGSANSALEDSDADLIMPGSFSSGHNRHQEFRATESDFPDLSPAGLNGTVELQQPCPTPAQSVPQRRNARPVTAVVVSPTITATLNSDAAGSAIAQDSIPQTSVSLHPIVQPQAPSVAAVVAASAAVASKPGAVPAVIPPTSLPPVSATAACPKVDDSAGMLANAAAVAAANMSYAAALKKTQTLPDSDSETDPPLASPTLLEEDVSVAGAQNFVAVSAPAVQPSLVPVAPVSRGASAASTTSATTADIPVQAQQQHSAQPHQAHYQSYSMNGRYNAEDEYSEDYEKQSQHQGASTYVRGGRGAFSRPGGPFRGVRGAQVSRGNGAARGRGLEQGSARGNTVNGRGGVRGRGGGAAATGGSNFRRNQYEER